MAVRPVKHYSAPRIPTRVEVDSQPELLQILPKRWHGNRAVAAALTATAAITSLAGCGGTRLAPVFKHGSGGDRATSMGVFAIGFGPSSEDEARQVILEEARRSGIEFRAPGPTIKGVEIPISNGFDSSHRSGTHKTEIELDGANQVYGIAYEVVSQDDIYEWHISRKGRLSAARTLRASLKSRNPGGTYAIFYEPEVPAREIVRAPGESTAIYCAKLDKAEREAEKAEREELRKQVRDFIKWLKSQGVI